MTSTRHRERDGKAAKGLVVNQDTKSCLLVQVVAQHLGAGGAASPGASAMIPARSGWPGSLDHDGSRRRIVARLLGRALATLILLAPSLLFLHSRWPVTDTFSALNTPWPTAPP